MIYTVTFNPAVDYVIRLPEITPGTVNRSRDEEIFFGGKGINVSIMLKNLGVESTVLGFSAGFTGRAIEDGIKDLGIRTEFIRLEKGCSRINVKIRSRDSETEINGQGPDIDQNALDSLFERLDRLQDGDILVLAGSIPPSLPEDIYERIMERLSDRDIYTAVDASGKLLTNVLPFRPFLVKPNQPELEEIFKKKFSSEEEVAEYAQKLREMGARNVLVSRDSRGAVLADENGIIHNIAAPVGKAVNSVGAGDSMLAGFIAGRLKENDLSRALALAAAAGSATAFSEGIADAEFVRRLFEEISRR